MKRLILLLCFGILVSIAANPSYENVIYIPFSPPLTPYEALSRAIGTVESKNDPNAYNSRENAVGIYQVRPIRLDDYYQRTGKRYELNEMYDTIKAKKVFLYYALQYHYSETERISREWNGGERGMKKQSTKSYYKKVKVYLENQN
jgi:soluble lytic murein transglycosylase-like protein